MRPQRISEVYKLQESPDKWGYFFYNRAAPGGYIVTPIVFDNRECAVKAWSSAIAYGHTLLSEAPLVGTED